jgi:hypothetical protein
MDLNKQKTSIIVFTVVLLLLTEFFVFEKISESREIELRFIAESGYSFGVQDSIDEIYKQMENCAIVSISVENKTKNLIDITCIDGLQKP